MMGVHVTRMFNSCHGKQKTTGMYLAPAWLR
jgi:hypothetical protein